MTERRLEEMMLATIALFFSLRSKSCEEEQHLGRSTTTLDKLPTGYWFQHPGCRWNEAYCTAGRQRRRTELEAEETGESELETTIKQFLSSRLYGIAVELRGNVFNLRPPASSKRREKKKARGKKPNSLNIDQQFVYSLMWPILTSQPYSNIECLSLNECFSELSWVSQLIDSVIRVQSDWDFWEYADNKKRQR